MRFNGLPRIDLLGGTPKVSNPVDKAFSDPAQLGDWRRRQQVRLEAWSEERKQKSNFNDFRIPRDPQLSYPIQIQRGEVFLCIGKVGTTPQEGLFVSHTQGELGDCVLEPNQVSERQGPIFFDSIEVSPAGTHATLKFTTKIGYSFGYALLDLTDPWSPVAVHEEQSEQDVAIGWINETSYFISSMVAGRYRLRHREVSGEERTIQIPTHHTDGFVVPLTDPENGRLLVLRQNQALDGMEIAIASLNSADTIGSQAFQNIPDFWFVGWTPAGPVFFGTDEETRKTKSLLQLAGHQDATEGEVVRLYNDTASERTLSGAAALGHGSIALFFNDGWGGNSWAWLEAPDDVYHFAPSHTVRVSETLPTSQGQKLLVKGTRWFQPPLTVELRPGSGTVSVLEDASDELIDVTVLREYAQSSDGTDVPLTLVMPTNPSGACILTGYGGFGRSTEPERLLGYYSWFENGGAIAFAHVRGGEELGAEWHEAGRGSSKINSFLDFIAAAKAIPRFGLRKPCAEGGSMGGTLVLASLVLDPDVFSGAIAGHPLTDFAA